MILRPKPVHLPAFLASCAAVLGLAGCGSDGGTEPSDPCRQPLAVCTVVGTGDFGFLGEGSVPLEAWLYWPIDVALDREGRLLVMDYNNLRLRRVDHDGRLRTILGTGFESFVEDSALALETPLHHAYSIDQDAAGDLYVLVEHTGQLFRLGTDDRVRILAGSGFLGFGGDGGPAREARMDYPRGVAVHPSGFPIYVADTFNHRIRVVTADGRIDTFAGTGERGYSGDEGPAAEARFHEPSRVRLDVVTGNLYVADTRNHVIRRISPDGTVTTVAGRSDGGEAGDRGGYSGDGGPAVDARLRLPFDASVGPDGSLYIADTGNHVLRRVDVSGTITTIAGNGAEGDSPDGTAALEASFNQPSAFCFDADGNLWVADTYNSKVKKVTGLLAVAPAAGSRRTP